MTGWPAAPTEAAFHGPAGEFVLRTEPHSEAHPMALLVQFLVAFGCACGRGAHYQVEADRHYSKEFVVLVGLRAVQRNKKCREIERAPGVLEEAGRLRRSTRQAERGRSTEVWIPVVAQAA